MLLVAKTILVAALAALGSGLPMGLLLAWGVDWGLKLRMLSSVLSIACMGVLVIGLPIAIATFFLVRDKAEMGSAQLLALANTVGGGLALLVVAGTGLFGLFYAVPSIIAANIFAVAGWHLILRPYRLSEHG